MEHGAEILKKALKVDKQTETVDKTLETDQILESLLSGEEILLPEMESFETLDESELSGKLIIND